MVLVIINNLKLLPSIRIIRFAYQYLSKDCLLLYSIALSQLLALFSTKEFWFLVSFAYGLCGLRDFMRLAFGTYVMCTLSTLLTRMYLLDLKRPIMEFRDKILLCFCVYNMFPYYPMFSTGKPSNAIVRQLISALNPAFAGPPTLGNYARTINFRYSPIQRRFLCKFYLSCELRAQLILGLIVTF